MISKQVKLKEELVEDPEVTHPGGGSKTEVNTVKTEFTRTDVKPEVKATAKSNVRMNLLLLLPQFYTKLFVP